MIRTDLPTATTPAPTRSVGSALALVAGFALQGVAAVFVAASGLMMPMWAVVVMWFVWLAGLVVQIRERRRPLAVVAVPVVIGAIWLLTGTLGETYLGWTA